MRARADEERADRPCAGCGGPLDADARYCLACGARRGPLPEAFRLLLGGDEPRARPADPESDEPSLVAMPSPRAAALAVLAILAFGVVVGTLVSPPADSAASAPLVIVRQPAAAPAATPTATPAPVSRRVHRTHRPAPGASPAPRPAPTAAPQPVVRQSAPPPPETTPPPPPTLPAVHHVFLIVLADHGYDAAFGPDSKAPYLSRTLTRRGELLPNYYAVAQSELANGIALISGQGPTAQTAAGCPVYSDVTPGTVGADGQVAGDGCVYPAQAQTLADQLTTAGSTWKAYVESIGSGAPPEPTTCRHPEIGAADPHQAPAPTDPYVTWRNPFVYFHSVIDVPACGTRDVGLDQLAHDIRAARTAPSFSLVVPDRCHDGSEAPCAPDAPAGLPAADEFLHRVVPMIEASAAYRDGGLIAITFDQAPQDGPDADATSCCDQPAFPNLAAPAATATPTATPSPTVTPSPTSTPTPSPTPAASPTPAPLTPPGGGRVGLLLISPFVNAGTVNGFGSYDHFSLLASIEDLFGLDRLGYAADPALPVFDRSTYNGSGGP